MYFCVSMGNVGYKYLIKIINRKIVGGERAKHSSIILNCHLLSPIFFLSKIFTYTATYNANPAIKEDLGQRNVKSVLSWVGRFFNSDCKKRGGKNQQWKSTRLYPNFIRLLPPKLFFWSALQQKNKWWGLQCFIKLKASPQGNWNISYQRIDKIRL